MATPDVITYLFSTASNFTGNTYLVGILILAFFVIGFMVAGIDFKWSIMFCIPLLMGISGYLFPVWVAGVIWMLVIGIGGYVAWSYVQERF